MNISIDTEFKNLIPPLTAEEYAGLEESILREGCRDAIVLWGETIIDGHNRTVKERVDRFIQFVDHNWLD